LRGLKGFIKTCLFQKQGAFTTNQDFVEAYKQYYIHTGDSIEILHLGAFNFGAIIARI